MESRIKGRPRENLAMNGGGVKEPLLESVARRTTEILKAANAALHNNAPKLHISGDELGQSGFVELSQSRIHLTIHRNHEKFLPNCVDKGVVLSYEKLMAVHENWTSFLSGDSPVFQSHVDRKGRDRAMSPVTFFYDIFYRRLFMLAPSLRKIFMQNMVRQSRFLVSITCECAGLYELLNSNKGLSGIESLARANAEFGIRPEHYDSIAIALRYSLAYCNGESLWHEVEKSWNDVVSFFVVASVCITINSLHEGERKETESRQWLELQKFRAAALKHTTMPPSPQIYTEHLESPNLMSRNSSQDSSIGDVGDISKAINEISVDHSGSLTGNFYPRRSVVKSDSHHDDNSIESKNIFHLKLNKISFPSIAKKHRDSEEEQSPISSNATVSKEISSISPSPHQNSGTGSTTPTSKRVRKALAHAAAIVHFKAHIHISATEDEWNISNFSGEQILLLVDRHTPEDLCQHACQFVDLLLKWFNPGSSAHEKSIALHASVGWVWKLSKIEPTDRKQSKIRQNALSNHLPRLVAAVLTCVEGWGTDDSMSMDSRMMSDPELQVEALDSLCQMSKFLQVHFKDQVELIQLAVNPLLEADDSEVREKAVNLIAILPLCIGGNDAFSNMISKVAIEAHTLLQQVWPDGDIDMGGAVLHAFPVLEHFHNSSYLVIQKEEIEQYIRMVSKRVPALIGVLIRLILSASTTPTLPHESSAPSIISHPRRASSVAVALEHAAETAAIEASRAQKSILSYSILILGLLERILRMGISVEKRCKEREDKLVQVKLQNSKHIPPESSSCTISRIALSSIQHAAVYLLDGIVTMNGLPSCLHKRTCMCLCHYVLAMPVKEGIRNTVFHTLASAIHGTLTGTAAFHLAVTSVPALIDELALLVGHEIPAGSHFCTPTGPITSFPINVPTSNFRPIQNCGHGETVDLETIATATFTLACLTDEYNDLYTFSTKNALENALEKGLLLLVQKGGNQKFPVMSPSISGHSDCQESIEDDATKENELDPPVIVSGQARSAFIELTTKYVISHRHETSTSFQELATAAFMACATDSDPCVAKFCRNALLNIWEMGNPQEITQSSRRNTSSKAASLLGLPTKTQPSSTNFSEMEGDPEKPCFVSVSGRHSRTTSHTPPRYPDESSQKSNRFDFGNNRLLNMGSNHSYISDSGTFCEDEKNDSRISKAGTVTTAAPVWSPHLHDKVETPRNSHH